MKTVVSFLLVSLLLTIVPETSGDLPAWNDGTTGTINVGTVNAGTTLNAAQGVFTNSVTSTGPIVIKQGSSTGLIATNTADQIGIAINAFAGQTNDLMRWNTSGTNSAKINSRGGVEFARKGSAADPLIVFPGTGVTNSGIWANSSFVFTLNGVNYLSLDSTSLAVKSTSQIGWSSGDPNASGADLILFRDTTATLQLGLDAASVVTPQTLKAADATGTDHNGAALQVEGGYSTGAGVPGDVIYRTSLYTNSSGSAANAYTTRGQIVGRPCALTNATATSFQRFTMATNTQAGIKIFATVTATDASFNKQSISSDVRVDAVNVSGTITATASETDNTLAANTGTLTIAYTVVDEGSNVMAIRANANSSLTTPTVKIKWSIQTLNSDGAITVTPVQL